MWRNGSRARLRIWWRKPWGFESPHPHKATSEGNEPSLFCYLHSAKRVSVERNLQHQAYNLLLCYQDGHLPTTEFRGGLVHCPGAHDSRAATGLHCIAIPHTSRLAALPIDYPCGIKTKEAELCDLEEVIFY